MFVFHAPGEASYRQFHLNSIYAGICSVTRNEPNSIKNSANTHFIVEHVHLGLVRCDFCLQSIILTFSMINFSSCWACEMLCQQRTEYTVAMQQCLRWPPSIKMCLCIKLKRVLEIEWAYQNGNRFHLARLSGGGAAAVTFSWRQKRRTKKKKLSRSVV